MNPKHAENQGKNAKRLRKEHRRRSKARHSRTPGLEGDTSIQIHRHRRPLPPRLARGAAPVSDGHAHPRTCMNGIAGNHKGGTRRSQPTDDDLPETEQRQMRESRHETGASCRHAQMGSSKGQKPIIGSLDEQKSSHRRRGTLSPPVLENPRAPEEPCSPTKSTKPA